MSHPAPRAVSRAAARPYKNRLLPLPRFLLPDTRAEYAAQDILDGLKLTGYFLEATVFAPNNHPLPAARDRLVNRLGRKI